MSVYDEVINCFLEHARLSLLQINHIMRVERDPFINVKTAVFAGMLAYYGQEYAEDIYMAFFKTKFIPCNQDMEQVIKEKYNLDSETIRKYVEHCPGTFYEAIAYYNRKDRSFKISRNLYLDERFSEAELIEGICHQMNHIINSINVPIFERARFLGARMGLAYDYFFDRKNDDLDLEEAINKLQVKDIMEEMFDFTYYDVKDKKVLEVLNSGLSKYDTNEADDQDNENSDMLLQIIKPLYENYWFNNILVDNRILGNLDKIRDDFDSALGFGYYGFLIGNLRKTASLGNTSDGLKHANCAKEIIKRYNEARNVE